MRLFVGVELDERVKDAAAEIGESLRRQLQQTERDQIGRAGYHDSALAGALPSTIGGTGVPGDSSGFGWGLWCPGQRGAPMAWVTP